MSNQECRNVPAGSTVTLRDSLLGLTIKAEWTRGAPGLPFFKLGPRGGLSVHSQYSPECRIIIIPASRLDQAASLSEIHPSSMHPIPPFPTIIESRPLLLLDRTASVFASSSCLLLAPSTVHRPPSTLHPPSMFVLQSCNISSAFCPAGLVWSGRLVV